MTKGLFITFEGGNGAGKSTQIERLKGYLEEQGYEVLLTREPGGTNVGEKIREVLLDPANVEMDPMTETMLYAAARAQLVAEVIRPALHKGMIVISDRFLDSSLAYQAWGRELGSSVLEINSYGIGDCMPDLTVYLRVDPDTGRKRIRQREQDRIESETEQFHQKVFNGYEQLCKDYPERIFCVDASRSIEDIEMTIRTEVKRRIDGFSSGK